MAGLREQTPPRALRAHVAAVWSLELEPQDLHRILPDGCVDLVEPPDGGVLLAGPATRPQLASLLAERGRFLQDAAAPV